MIPRQSLSLFCKDGLSVVGIQMESGGEVSRKSLLNADS